MSILNDLLPSKKSIFTKKYPLVEEVKTLKSQLPSFVPQGYQRAVAEGSRITGIDPKILSSLINTENAQWNPTAKSYKKVSTAVGLGQHNDDTYTYINNLFKPRYGRDYNRTNGADNIIATALYLKNLVDKPEIGNIDNAIKAYKIGTTGFIKSQGNPKSWRTKDAEKYYNKIKSFY